MHPLRGLLDAKRGVLVGDHIVLLFGVDRLQVLWHVDVVGGQLVLAKVLKEVRMVRLLHVDVREARVFVLQYRLVLSCYEKVRCTE
jgi:hypothetical protein